MQHMVIQPLDLLPPVDATFRDYALAVLRAEETANPTDPDDDRGQMLDAFINRGILDESDRAQLRKPHHVFERLDLDVFRDTHTIGSSRSDAYRFLDDNRRKLFIPPNADVVVADVCAARKLTREARRLPAQVILQYIWREDVALNGREFGRFDGQQTTMLCGGTLVLNETGDVAGWARKAGSQPTGKGEAAKEEQKRGAAKGVPAHARQAHQCGRDRLGDRWCEGTAGAEHPAAHVPDCGWRGPLRAVAAFRYP